MLEPLKVEYFLERGMAIQAGSDGNIIHWKIRPPLQVVHVDCGPMTVVAVSIVSTGNCKTYYAHTIAGVNVDMAITPLEALDVVTPD